MNETKKKILYVDMDNVLVDFPSGMRKVGEKKLAEHPGKPDEVPGIFSQMDPMPGAVTAMHELAKYYDIYILSTAPWLNPSAWSDKLKWVQQHFGKDEGTLFWKRLIISHHKNLNRGDFLIDDKKKNGAEDFEGELIQFGTPQYPDWPTMVSYLLNKI